MSESISFWVAGLPIPQGSTRAFQHRTTGRVIVTSDAGQKLKDWRGQIGYAAREAMRDRYLIEKGAVSVAANFYLPRPKSRPKREIYPDRRPDIDKLTRALLDALTNVVWRDDSQVVVLSVVKAYGTPGADVRIEALQETKS